MAEHPDVVILQDKHRAEIDELVTAFAAKHAELVHAEPKLRDAVAEAALKTRFRTDILAAIARHTAEANALSAQLAGQAI